MFSPLIILGLIFVATLYIRHYRRPLPLPPGPRRFPIVGNLFNRPIHKTWLTYTDWKDIYGDVLSMEILGKPVIILNTQEAATELLEKKSANFSDRPPFYMLNDLMNWAWDLGNMRYTDEWKIHRKTFHQYFQAKGNVVFAPVQIAATKTLVELMFKSPGNLASHVRHYTGSVILRLTYGYNAQPVNDPYVALADKAFRGIVLAAIFGNSLVDYFPILKWMPAWFPFASFKREAAIAARDSDELLHRPFEDTLEAIRAKTCIPCFVSDNMEKMNSETTRDRINMMDVVRNCAGVAFVAGSDAVIAVVMTTILALIHYPEVQAKAHDELDEVVGRDRMPTFEDQSHLKYLEAILLEAMRWRPVTPLGYYIPRGSIIFGNTWALLHDKNTYPNPDSFIPERFLGNDPQPNPVDHGSFGFGRRICPGRNLANQTAFTALVAILWGFELGCDKGEALPDVNAYTDGLISQPLPFKCKVVPRFDSISEIVQESSD